MLWLLWCPVELLSFNQNEISDIPAAALLWQDDLPSSFWRDNLSFLFFLKSCGFSQRSTPSIPILFSPTCHAVQKPDVRLQVHKTNSFFAADHESAQYMGPPPSTPQLLVCVSVFMRVSLCKSDLGLHHMEHCMCLTI